MKNYISAGLCCFCLLGTQSCTTLRKGTDAYANPTTQEEYLKRHVMTEKIFDDINGVIFDSFDFRLEVYEALKRSPDVATMLLRKEMENDAKMCGGSARLVNAASFIHPDVKEELSKKFLDYQQRILDAIRE